MKALKNHRFLKNIHIWILLSIRNQKQKNSHNLLHGKKETINS